MIYKHTVYAQNIFAEKLQVCQDKAGTRGKKIILELNKMTTLFDLHGKTAIITGISSGLGEQFASSLSGAGARVILAALRIH